MSPLEWLSVVVVGPPIWILAGYLGWAAGRWWSKVK